MTAVAPVRCASASARLPICGAGASCLLDVDGHADLFAEHAQLLGGGGALEVGGDEQGAQAVLLQVQREPRSERGLARALHAADEDLRRSSLCAEQRLVVAAEDLDQLVVDGADHLLPGRDRLQQLAAGGALPHARDELAHDLEVHIGLEQRDAHLAQRRIEVVLGNPPAAAEAAEGGLEAFAQGFQHRGECSRDAARGGLVVV